MNEVYQYRYARPRGIPGSREVQGTITCQVNVDTVEVPLLRKIQGEGYTILHATLDAKIPDAQFGVYYSRFGPPYRLFGRLGTMTKKQMKFSKEADRATSESESERYYS